MRLNIRPLSRLLAVSGAGGLLGAVAGGPIGLVGGLLLGGFAEEAFARHRARKMGDVASIGCDTMGADAPSATGLKAGQRLVAGQQIQSPSGASALTMQPDGDLVLSSQGQTLWSSGTGGSGGVAAVMQKDGNLAVVGPGGNADILWSSGTAGQPGSRLTVHDDGNLVVYSSMGIPAWQSRTAQA